MAICKNCGGEKGIHHYQTMACPVGGREAPVGKPQEWMSSDRYETETEEDALREIVNNLLTRVAELEDQMSELQAESNLRESVSIWGAGN